jgi:hypothetical protein
VPPPSPSDSAQFASGKTSRYRHVLTSLHDALDTLVVSSADADHVDLHGGLVVLPRSGEGRSLLDFSDEALGSITWHPKAFYYDPNSFRTLFSDVQKRVEGYRGGPAATWCETADFFGWNPKLIDAPAKVGRRMRRVRAEVDKLLARFEPDSPERRFFASLLGRSEPDRRNAPPGAPRAPWVAELRRAWHSLVRRAGADLSKLQRIVEHLLRDVLELGYYLRSLTLHASRGTSIAVELPPLVRLSLARHVRSMTRPAYAW